MTNDPTLSDPVDPDRGLPVARLEGGTREVHQERRPDGRRTGGLVHGDRPDRRHPQPRRPVSHWLRPRSVRPWRPHRLAPPPKGPDPLRHRRHRPGRHPYRRRAGDPTRRRGLHRARRGALARSHAGAVHGTCRHAGGRRERRGRDLARPRHQRRVRSLTLMTVSTEPVRRGPASRGQRANGDRMTPGRSRLTRAVVVNVVLLTMIAPLATDMYVPGFPAVGRDLHASATGVQLTLTTFFVGMALGQLAGGPISDQRGRRRPLLAALAVMLLASTLCALSPSIAVMMLARFVQGFSGGWAMVIGRSIVIDLASQSRLVRALNVIQGAAGIAPIIGPLLGGLIMQSFGWRLSFWVLAMWAAIMIVTVMV